MKNFKLSIILIFVALFFSPFIGLAEEKILDFSSDIQVQKNANLLVTETITVQSEGKVIQHGIYRDFPTTYSDSHGQRIKVKFDVLSATRDGQSESFSISSQINGERVYLGNPNWLLPPGQYKYALTYRVDRELGFFADHDELYWNVTGNGWKFLIDKAEATVTLPSGIEGKDVTYKAYTGVQGALGTDYSSLLATTSPVRVIFATTQTLLEGQGLTIVVGWPKGFVVAPTQAEQYKNLLTDNQGPLLGGFGLLIVLIYFSIAWSVVGRDPKKGTIIPLYEAPGGMTPAAIRYLAIRGCDSKTLAASVIYLAVNGYLKIEKKLEHFFLTRLGDKVPDKNSEEELVLNSLLPDSKTLRLDRDPEVSSKISVAMEDLTTSLSESYGENIINNWKIYIIGLVATVLTVLSGVLLMMPGFGAAVFMIFWLSIWTIGTSVLLAATIKAWTEIISGNGGWVSVIFLTLFSTPFFIAEMAAIFLFTGGTLTSFWIIGEVALLILVNAVFYHLLKNVTPDGRLLLDQIEGFKWFLSVTEKDRLNFSNPPELTSELFEKFLPYALALGVENKWAEQFANVFAQTNHGASYVPLWYGSSLGSVGEIANFTSSFSSSISSASTAPGSSSGFGGGGSSGGGGGGGGGGGW
jgi:uncharacterized membrane protein YgcG